MTTRRPGIIVRLGNLIIVQVLFIFAALSLILFVPESDQELGERLAEYSRNLHEVDRLAAKLHRSYHDLQADSYDFFTNLFDSLPVVDRAAVLHLRSGDRIEVAYVYQDEPAPIVADLPEYDVSEFCNLDMLRLMASSDSALPLQYALAPHYLVSYQRLAEENADRPAILVVAVKHGFSVSSLSNLQYAVLVLFLCSTLVSLLTVYLLLRKFKRPLDRIIAGFEETAGGKLHHLAELEKDPQLGKLARAYNSMAKRLWDSRKELDAYFTRLETANVELRESQSFLTTLIDCSPLAIIVTDPNGTIIMFNRAASQMFGYQADDIVGRPVTTLVTIDPGQSGSVIEEGDRRSVEVICRRTDGAVFPGYVITSRIETEPDGVVARLYVCRDITDSKNFQDMMIRLDRYYSRGEMAGDIAHEINNYLAVLMGNVELLPLLLKKGKMEKVDKKLEVMKHTLEKIARFSDGLLNGPPDTVHLEPSSINQIVENVIAFLKPQNKFDIIDVINELSTEVPVLQADQAQIQQLLVNLIYNAAEALAETEGEKTIHVVTATTEIDEKPGVKITVRDCGPGVVPDKESLLFNTRFTTKPRGHGIGLITCRKIVDNHGGDITYRRQNGAVFDVLLPVNKLEPDPTEPVTEMGNQPA